MDISSSDQLGDAIKERRNALSLTQAQLAEKAGVSRLWINQIEKGKDNASLQLVIRTLNALDLILVTKTRSEGREQIRYVFNDL